MTSPGGIFTREEILKTYRTHRNFTPFFRKRTVFLPRLNLTEILTEIVEHNGIHWVEKYTYIG